jgi:molybdopterin-guanine dinucleotide biosynthesis protein A
MTFSALLLAGGESRRMGRDKATIEFEGQPLWKTQLELLRALSPEKIFVSARRRPDWLPDTVVLLLDDRPSRGPLSGLVKAFAAIETSHLIVLAIDMPFMTAAELRRLLELSTENCGVVPMIDEHAEPLAAVYPASAAEHFKAALTGPDFSLQSVVRNLARMGHVRPWDVRDANFYRNLNQPSDLKLFEEFDA